MSKEYPMTSRSIINAVEIFPLYTNDKKRTSLLLTNTLKKTLFNIDSIELLYRELYQLQLNPQEVDIDLIYKQHNSVNTENSEAKRGFMVDDPNIGKVLLCIDEITVSVH